MKIGITGASGFVGSAVTKIAGDHGHGVIGFSRNPARALAGCEETRVIGPDGALDLSGCEAVIHLAGENVFGLWTPGKKKRILESRTVGTRNLVETMLRCGNPPEVLVSASAIGFYGDTGEYETGETAAPGEGFLAEVTQAWEHEAQRAAEGGIRVVFLRIAIVFGENGGALGKMAPLFRMGLGGKIGDGRQWMSWIHREDLGELALFAVENRAVAGPLNASSPEPVRNADFTTALAKAVNRPAFFSVPAFLLTSALGEFSRELLDSKRIIPTRPLALGFPFRHTNLAHALASIVHRS